MKSITRSISDFVCIPEVACIYNSASISGDPRSLVGYGLPPSSHIASRCSSLPYSEYVGILTTGITTPVVGLAVVSHGMQGLLLVSLAFRSWLRDVRRRDARCRFSSFVSDGIPRFACAVYGVFWVFGTKGVAFSASCPT